MKKMVLFRVDAGGDAGSGHLNRCLVLARLLKKDHDPYFLVRGDNRIGEILYRENLNFRLAMHGHAQEIEDIRGLRPNLIFLDMRSTPIAFVRAIREYAPVLDLDDGGDGADAADCVVYSLPLAAERRANFNSLSYLVFDPAITAHARKSMPGKTRKVLVSFGGSDPQNLSSVMIRVSKLCPARIDWTFVRGEFNQQAWPDGRYTAVERPDSLFKLIAENDLLVTSFGMTAFEGAAIGTPVALLNPTPYHEQLTEAAACFTQLGLYTTGEDGDNTPDIARGFTRLLEEGVVVSGQAERNRELLDGRGSERLLGLITMLLQRRRNEACPVCNTRSERALRRSDKRNLFLCEHCGLLSQQYFEAPDFTYEKSYFNDEYKDQYGTSYLEDRINIDRMNRPRLAVIEELHAQSAKKAGWSGGEKQLLEIGSAYGFFLDIARDKGWTVQGIEVSKAAAKYAWDSLRLDIRNESFPDAEPEKEKFHALALWYTIEHIPRLDQAMERCYTSLVRGGVLALSTPNSRGISGRRDRENYLDRIPADHFFEFTIPNLKRLLKRYRFQVKRVRVTGIHYDRFLGEERKGGFWDKAFFRRIYEWLARRRGLGDTFEIYAIKR